MVLEFYNLREQPFGVTPDPKYLYLSPTHREALASLEYGISSSRGFLALIAPPGMGKTTILFQLLQRLNQTARTVFIFQTHATPRDFLRNLLSDLGLSGFETDLVTMQAELNKTLLEEAKAGKRVVVVVDEAQNLEDPVLEHLRMLSNFETTSEKLIQIVLAGQTQLADKLALPSLVQLRQRISMMGRLAPFDREETERYICHRLEVAGFEGALPLFTRQALRLIAEASGGIPRNINNLCFNALALGCANRQRMIPTETIQEVCQDLDLSTVRRLAPPVLAVDASPAASRGAEAKVTRPKNEAFPEWWLRFGRAALILAIAIASIAVPGFNKGTFREESTPKPHAASINALPMSVETLNNTAIPQKPSNLTVETGDTAGLATESLTLAQSAGASTQPEAPPAIRTVLVVQDQTLSRIVIHELGEFTAEKVKTIQELNPWLTNPDHILAGQTIRIPESDSKQNGRKTTIKSFPEADKP
jgi:type II secretory pathway predicted ATPase ExeA